MSCSPQLRARETQLDHEIRRGPLKGDFGVGRGRAMAFLHVLKNGATIIDKHFGSNGTHRDESNELRLDG